MRKGFSILEVIIVMAIAVVILFSLSSFRTNFNVIDTLLSQELQSRQDLDDSMQIMTTEIRSAAPSSLGAYPIDAAATSSLAFYSDMYRNGTFERVRYFLSSSTLYKGVIVPGGNPLVYATSSELVSAVATSITVTTSTPLFTYYDANYTGTSSSSAPMSYPVNIQSVRLVQVQFYAAIQGSSSTVPQLFSSMISIRNLRSN